jgi:hypothetical protein
VKAVSEETGLLWDTVKDLDKLYMNKQLAANPVQAPKRLGIDEISIGKGHSYRIIVHDLDRKRPIWVGDDRGRSREAIDAYFQSLSDLERVGIELGVMDTSIVDDYATWMSVQCFKSRELSLCYVVISLTMLVCGVRIAPRWKPIAQMQWSTTTTSM